MTKIGSGIAKVTGRIGKSLMRCKPIAKVLMKAEKNKPEILAVTSGICVVAAFGWAIYEAVTVKDAMTESTNRVKTVEEARDQALAEEGITEEKKAEIIKAANRDLTTARIEGGWIVVRKFVGPAGLLILGMGLGGRSVKIFRARNLVLTGALKSTEDILKFYRGNVREELGEEADLKFLRGVTGEKKIEETQKDATGGVSKVEKTLPVVKSGNPNPWRFAFDEEHFDSWQPDTDLNLFYLKCEQDWWQHEYDRNDIVTMYEILKHMRYRFDRAKASMSKKEWNEFMNFIRNHGWWKGSKGDGFIDLGIYRAINEPAIRRTSDVIFVEMNCDGCLLTM